MNLVTVQGLKGQFIDKRCCIYENEPLAEQKLKEMFSEFFIAKDLNHPNINHYQYFIRKYEKAKELHEFHILQEYL